MFDNDNNFWFFIRTKFHIIMSVITCIITVVLLIVLVNINIPANESITSSIQVKVPEFSEGIQLTNDAILSYLEKDPFTTSIDEIMKAYNGSTRFINKGLAFTFSYGIEGMYAGVFTKRAELHISEDNDFTHTQTYIIEGKSIDVYSLKTNTQYYYRIIVMLSDNSVVGKTGMFKTVDSPRILNIEGIVNVRDIGGWETTEGKRIKQGLLYRGSELDGAVEKNYCLTEKGLSDMLNVLKIRSDMDLRSPLVNEETTDALGSTVKHTYYNAPAYASVFEESREEAVRKIFSDLAKKENYPVYLHCTYGKDRTGTVCYLLEALLGVSKENIKRDYALSEFTHGEAEEDHFTSFTAELEQFQGDTLKDKTENYLLSIGVTSEEIANIRTIFLGE